MKYPKFFDQLEKIVLRDELALTLGVFEDGIVEFSYLDVVKSAGHSCPTVSGAFLMCLIGLKKLYQNELPKRGEIKVELPNDIASGVSGVIGGVISNITGATTNSGFKGLNGKFGRTNLLFYGVNIDSDVRFTRVDTNKSVDIYYNLSLLNSTKTDFQERVFEIFANTDIVFTTKENF